MIDYPMSKLAHMLVAISATVGPERSYDYDNILIKEPRTKDWEKRKAKRVNAKKARRRAKK